ADLAGGPIRRAEERPELEREGRAVPPLRPALHRERAARVQAEVEDVEAVRLLDEREHEAVAREIQINMAVSTLRRRGQRVDRVDVVVERQADLLQVVDALDPAGGL